MTTDAPIKLEVKDKVAHFILDNPPENKMNQRFLECMREKLNELMKMKDIGAIVVYGSGNHFSSGADVDYIKATVVKPIQEGISIETVVNDNIYATSLLLTYLESSKIPSIAAISGLCIGSGLEIALACNVRVCSQTSLIGSPELSFGIMPGLGGTVKLSRIVGIAKAKEIILSGDMLSGSEAYEIGLANYVMKKNKVLPFALELAANVIKDRQKYNSRRFIELMNC